MRHFWKDSAIIGLTAAAFLSGGTIARAQTLQERVEALEKKANDGQKDIADQLGIKIHGLVAVDYLYDINRPDNHTPFLRSFENDSNSFILNLANLHVERQPESGLGFVADLDFGKTADVVNNTTFFNRNQTGNGTDFFDARQFYLTYTAPVGSGLKLKAGRMVTLHGAEVIKAYNNLNYNVTNSILFGYSIPFTHTGLMGSYAFSDQVSMDLGVVNGWDTVADNNDGKSVHGGLNIAPDPRFSIYFSGTYGPEQNHNARSKRLMLASLITIKPMDQLTFLIDYNYGNESNVALGPTTTSATALDPAPGNAMWQGVAGYVILAATDELQLSLRGEVFDDPDGVRTLFRQAGFGPGATFWEVTPTVSYKLADGLFWRNEFRHDEADKKAYPRENRMVSGQDTLATELVYTF